MSVVSVINYKGGVGKTTLTANLGAELATRGRRVLLIDLDPQASLTSSFFQPAQWERELAEERTILQWFGARARPDRPAGLRRVDQSDVAACDSMNVLSHLRRTWRTRIGREVADEWSVMWKVAEPTVVGMPGPEGGPWTRQRRIR